MPVFTNNPNNPNNIKNINNPIFTGSGIFGKSVLPGRVLNG